MSNAIPGNGDVAMAGATLGESLIESTEARIMHFYTISPSCPLCLAYNRHATKKLWDEYIFSHCLPEALTVQEAALLYKRILFSIFFFFIAIIFTTTWR